MLGMHVRFALPAGLRRRRRRARAARRCSARRRCEQSAAARRGGRRCATRCTPTRGCRWGRRTRRRRGRRRSRRFTVDETLMAHAAPGAVFMHCLPAYRGLEVDRRRDRRPAERRVPAGPQPAARGPWRAGVPDRVCDGDGTTMSKVQRQQTIARLIGQHAGDQPAAARRAARRRGHRRHAGHRVARPRRPRCGQGARARRRDGVRHSRVRARPRSRRSTSCGG